MKKKIVVGTFALMLTALAMSGVAFAQDSELQYEDQEISVQADPAEKNGENRPAKPLPKRKELKGKKNPPAAKANGGKMKADDCCKNPETEDCCNVGEKKGAKGPSKKVNDCCNVGEKKGAKGSSKKVNDCCKNPETADCCKNPETEDCCGGMKKPSDRKNSVKPGEKGVKGKKVDSRKKPLPKKGAGERPAVEEAETESVSE